MKLVEVKVVPAKEQRYPTVGDWWYDGNGTLQIRVSHELGNPSAIEAVALHEQIEAFRCTALGITEKAVTDFDLLYVQERALGKHTEDDEPGDDPRAPYQRQHFFATNLEFQYIYECGITVKEYEDMFKDL